MSAPAAAGDRVLRKVFSTLARRTLGPITHVRTREAVAALTFDDGPDPELTLRALETLERHRARATFFMIGRSAAAHPDAVRRVVAGGHAVGNHSWDHPSLAALGPRERRRQLRACARALAPHGGRLLRPPYGRTSVGLSIDARRLGYEIVVWNVDVGDWWDPDADRMASELARRVAPGSIVCLHDVLVRGAASLEPALERRPHPDRRAMLGALDRFLAGAAGRLRFVTVPELMTTGDPVRRGW